MPPPQRDRRRLHRKEIEGEAEYHREEKSRADDAVDVHRARVVVERTDLAGGGLADEVPAAHEDLAPRQLFRHEVHLGAGAVPVHERAVGVIECVLGGESAHQDLHRAARAVAGRRGWQVVLDLRNHIVARHDLLERDFL